MVYIKLLSSGGNNSDIGFFDGASPVACVWVCECVSERVCECVSERVREWMSVWVCEWESEWVTASLPAYVHACVCVCVGADQCTMWAVMSNAWESTRLHNTSHAPVTTLFKEWRCRIKLMHWPIDWTMSVCVCACPSDSNILYIQPHWHCRGPTSSNL